MNFKVITDILRYTRCICNKTMFSAKFKQNYWSQTLTYDTKMMKFQDIKDEFVIKICLALNSNEITSPKHQIMKLNDKV
jgi:hypothetical protein